MKPPSFAPASADVSGASLWVAHSGLKLHVWEKYVDSPAGKPLVVLVHGSSTAGRETFDLQVPGQPSYSLMDTLALAGFDVFAPDVRGFGRSTRPAGHMTAQQASDDLNAVIDEVRALRGATQVHLLAWSWGTQVAGLLAMAHPAKVARYVSLAQMHVNSPDLAQRRLRVEAFRRTPYIRIPEEGWKARFYSSTPALASDPAVVDAYANAASQAEPRTPTGPQLDLVTLLPLLDPLRITMPTMLVHGEHDDVADLDGLLPFFKALPNPDKRYVQIPGAGHMLHLQKAHRLLQHAVLGFFTVPGMSSASQWPIGEAI